MQRNKSWRGKPRLGQHFLADAEACRIIVEAAHIAPGAHVVEIGPGKGALTALLTAQADRLTLVEPDRELASRIASQNPRAEIIGEKGEDVDYSLLPGPLTVVSNLPYYASVHIFKHLTQHKANIRAMVLMFQKEVAQRISATPGGRHYGSLSAWSGYHWEMEQVLAVPPSAFVPPPKVESAVVRFLPRAMPPVRGDETELFRLVRTSFTQKRRTLKNNLKGIYSPESVEAAFGSAGLHPNVRAEEVSLERFAAMAPLLHQIGEPLETDS
jgi:16S rRNA (adenine1518-N6/adenine1519-N6)-dimethyltransferase